MADDNVAEALKTLGMDNLIPDMTPAPTPEPKAEPVAGSSLADKLANAPEAKRGPGRPPGRKNNATLAREAQEGVRKNPPSKMVVPPDRTKKPKDVPELSPQERHRIKLGRAEELAEKVSETINDNLMLMLMAMGAPTELLYKPGQEPARVKAASSKYTDLGQMLTLSPMQANIAGRFLAELESTEIGGKIGGVATDGKGPLIIYGILTAAGAIQYGKQLMDFYQKMEPMLAAYKAQKAQQEAQQFNQHQTTGG